MGASGRLRRRAVERARVKVVAFDADVLGRQRTGDETYALNLLRELGRPRLGRGYPARRGHAPARPRAARASSRSRSRPARRSCAWPGRCPGFSAGSARTSCTRSTPCPFAARAPPSSPCTTSRSRAIPSSWAGRIGSSFGASCRARFASGRRVLTVSERTKADLVELYGLSARARRRDAERRRPRLSRRRSAQVTRRHKARTCSRSAPIQARKNQLAALEAAEAVGLPLVVVGPDEGRRGCRRAAAARCAARGLRRDRAARRAVSRRRVSRAVEPVRGLRASGRGGHGVGHAGRRRPRSCVA